MRIEVLTSLYPSPPRPHEGIFAERRWTGMQTRGHEVHVVHPLPRTGPFVRGSWAEILVDGVQKSRGRQYQEAFGPGRHIVVLQREGWVRVDTTVTIVAGDTLRLDVVMREQGGT